MFRGSLVAVLAGLLVAGYGCCGSDPDSTMILETGALQLPAVEAATGVPASWFLAAGPMEGIRDEDLEACTRGESAGLPLRFAVVEVGVERITLGGEPVMDLDRGLSAGAGGDGILLVPLRDALDALVDDARQLSALGCRPWTHGSTAPPAGFRDAEIPPLLLAVDARVPARTLAQAIYTAGHVGFDGMSLWVDDPTPAGVEASPTPLSGGQVAVRVAPDGIRWAWGEDGAPDLLSLDDMPPQTANQVAAAVAERVDGPIPEGMVVLGEGTTGDHVLAQDALARAGIHCVQFYLAVGEIGGAPAGGEGGGTVTTLQPDSTVAVLPIVLPKIVALVPDEVRGTPTLTGWTCPEDVDIEYEGTVLDPPLDLFEGMDLGEILGQERATPDPP